MGKNTHFPYFSMSTVTQSIIFRVGLKPPTRLLRSLRPLLQQLASGLDGVTVAGVECPEDGAGRLRMGKAIGLAMENEETMVISWILNGIFIYLHINLN